jgi:putative transposase
MVRPSQRREMAKQVVMQRGVGIGLACKVFVISETCYRYEPKLSEENTEIADWLIRLTDNQRNWGFGLYFLYLRNVKGFGWNHKRVYRGFGNSRMPAHPNAQGSAGVMDC